MEILSNHMKNFHNESPCQRIDRLGQTFTSILRQESSKVKQVSGCSECGVFFTTHDEQNTHNKNYHKLSIVKDVIEDTDFEFRTELICELCDRVFPNIIQRNNHRLLVHTVKSDQMICDYCGEMAVGLLELVKHISNKHSELFPKKHVKNDVCDLCYKTFQTP